MSRNAVNTNKIDAWCWGRVRYHLCPIQGRFSYSPALFTMELIYSHLNISHFPQADSSALSISMVWVSFSRVHTQHWCVQPVWKICHSNYYSDVANDSAVLASACETNQHPIRGTIDFILMNPQLIGKDENLNLTTTTGWENNQFSPEFCGRFCGMLWGSKSCCFSWSE